MPVYSQPVQYQNSVYVVHETSEMYVQSPVDTLTMQSPLEKREADMPTNMEYELIVPTLMDGFTAQVKIGSISTRKSSRDPLGNSRERRRNAKSRSGDRSIDSSIARERLRQTRCERLDTGTQ
jgi:hypothetical protein